jgi:hypothetical protein
MSRVPSGGNDEGAPSKTRIPLPPLATLALGCVAGWVAWRSPATVNAFFVVAAVYAAADRHRVLSNRKGSALRRAVLLAVACGVATFAWCCPAVANPIMAGAAVHKMTWLLHK